MLATSPLKLRVGCKWPSCTVERTGVLIKCSQENVFKTALGGKGGREEKQLLFSKPTHSEVNGAEDKPKSSNNIEK